MTKWRIIPELRRVTWCGVALELRDGFTGKGVFGGVTLSLDRQRGTEWVETNISPKRNSGGVFLYTGLGRLVDPIALQTFRVRVRINADFYHALYQTTNDAIEFDVPAYNDDVPPTSSPLVPVVVMMLPTAGYPYSGQVRRIHGRVLDPLGEPVADATIVADGVERVITGNNGAFTLPLRWQGPTANVNVEAEHPRSGRSATQVFSLPGALTGNQDIQVT